MNVYCVPLAKRLHELAVQSVKIVVRADTVMGAKNANLVNTVPLLCTILRRVRCAVLEGISLTMGKQAVYHAHLESINISKEQKNVWTAKLDDRRTLPGTMHQSVAHV